MWCDPCCLQNLGLEHQPFFGCSGTRELHSLRCCWLLMDAAGTSALNPAKVRLWKPGSITSQNIYESLAGDRCQHSHSRQSMAVPARVLPQILSGPCNTEQTEQLPHPFLKITSVSGRPVVSGRLAWKPQVGFRKSHPSTTGHPGCRIYLWMGHNGSNYGFDFWYSCYHKNSICKLGLRTEVWFVRLY